MLAGYKMIYDSQPRSQGSSSLSHNLGRQEFYFFNLVINYFFSPSEIVRMRKTSWRQG